MQLTPKTVILKDGRTALLRTPRPDEAGALTAMIKKAWGETDFLLRGAEDVADITLESERAWIENAVASENKLVIICDIGGIIAGISEIGFFTKQKVKHRASIGVTVLKDYWNLGIGSAFFTELIAAATARDEIEIVELEFIEGNARARALYEKFGFRIVSQKPDAIRLKDGTYKNEYYMQKRL